MKKLLTLLIIGLTANLITAQEITKAKELHLLDANHKEYN